MQDTPFETAVDPVVLASLATERAAHIVDYLNERSADDAAALLSRLPLAKAVEVFDQPELRRAGDLIEGLSEPLALVLLREMSADRAVDTLHEVGPARRARLLAGLDADVATPLRTLLAYPKDSAGAIMTTEFVSVAATATASETLEHIRSVEQTRETIYAICLLDPATRALVQTLSLRRLIMGEPGASALSLALPQAPITVTALTDREEVARLVSVHDLLAVPVVDERGRVLGIVTVDDVIDAIVAESTEDVQRFGGVEATNQPYLQIGFLEMIRKRAGWLSVLFLSEMLTASAMQHFADELQKAVVLTLFIPLIMSSGGNSGSQATSLLIRALALGQLRLRDWWRVAIRELPTGLVLGAMLGLIGVIRIAAWQKLGIYDYGPHWVLIATTVAAGLVGIVTFGSMAGSMLPFLLKRLGFDPASASAPFVATLVDVTGLVIYFSVAYAILRGTLL
jgi:magnesium transporter